MFRSGKGNEYRDIYNNKTTKRMCSIEFNVTGLDASLKVQFYDGHMILAEIKRGDLYLYASRGVLSKNDMDALVDAFEALCLNWDCPPFAEQLRSVYEYIKEHSPATAQELLSNIKTMPNEYINRM